MSGKIEYHSNEQQFNNDVTFLKDVRILGIIRLGDDVSADGEDDTSAFSGDVIFNDNVEIKGNLEVLSNVDIVGLLTVREQLDVGIGGTILRSDHTPTGETILSVGSANKFVSLSVSAGGTTFKASRNEDDKVQVSIAAKEVESYSVFQVNDDLTNTFLIKDTGVVGIGTKNPGAYSTNDGTIKLDIDGSVSIQDEIYDSRNVQGSPGQFLSKDENGITWVSIEPQATDGINLMDEGVFVPTPDQGGSVGAAQTFAILNFVQRNSLGIGTDTLEPTARDPQNFTGLATIFTQDLWGFVGSGNDASIYRMTKVGINNDDPTKQLDITGTLRATGIVEFTSNQGSNANNTGALVVTGGLGVGENLNMGGDLDVDGTGKIGSSQGSSANDEGALVVTGGLGVGENLNMQGNLDVDGTGKIGSSQGSTSNTLGALVVTGGVGIGENLNMGGNIDVDGTGKIGSNLDSDANDTGALTVDGGLGLGKNLNMGGALDVDQGARIGSTLELDGALKDINNTTGTGKTDYRLATVGTGVSWRPPGVETKKTIWVSKNGSDLNSGLLEGDAKASLGGAAAVAQEGDTIKIRPGKYLENNPVGLRTDVSVTGEDLRLVTIVPQNKNDDVIHVRRGCLVENLSFAGGVVGSGVEIGCDRAGAVAFPPTQTDIDAGISVRARSGFTGLGPADEGSSGRWRSPYIRNCTESENR